MMTGSRPHAPASIRPFRLRTRVRRAFPAVTPAQLAGPLLATTAIGFVTLRPTGRPGPLAGRAGT
jgi:hypothetical protein